MFKFVKFEETVTFKPYIFLSHPINRENASYIHLQIISYQVENLNEVSNQIYEEILAEFPNCEILIKEE